MFKWLLTVALALSILLCVWCELLAQQRLRARQASIVTLRAQLAPLRAIVNEVDEYQRMKDAMMARIDAINRQKQNQKGAAVAVAKLAGVDPKGVESVAVVDSDLVVNRR